MLRVTVRQWPEVDEAPKLVEIRATRGAPWFHASGDEDTLSVC